MYYIYFFKKYYLGQWGQVLRSDVSVSAEAACHDHRARVLCQHCHISSGSSHVSNVSLFCIALGPRECGSLQGSCPVEDGIATDRVCCTAVHSLHGTLWAASVHTEHILSVRRLSLDPQVFWTKNLCSERNQGCSRHRNFKHNDKKYQGKKRLWPHPLDTINWFRHLGAFASYIIGTFMFNKLIWTWQTCHSICQNMCQGFLKSPQFRGCYNVVLWIFDVLEFLTNDVEDCEVAATIYFNLNKWWSV